MACVFYVGNMMKDNVKYISIQSWIDFLVNIVEISSLSDILENKGN
jgi:hypothetical protein